MYRALVGLLLALLSGSPVLAETFETPRALLEALYNGRDQSGDGNSEDWPYKAYYSDHLNGLMQADRNSTAEGEMGALEFDPVISGQDGEAANVKIGKPAIQGDTAKVVVKFTNFDPVTLTYTMVKEHGGWKVDDIGNKGGEFPWTLSKIFEGAR